MGRERDHVAQHRQDAEALVPSRLEVATQSLLRDLIDDAGRIRARAGDCQRFGVEVGREDPEADPLVLSPGLIEDLHGDRVRLFPGCAARDPSAHVVPRRRSLYQRLDDRLPERRVGLRVPKEVSYVDEQIADQHLPLDMIRAEHLVILVQTVVAGENHPAHQATMHGARLVVS